MPKYNTLNSVQFDFQIEKLKEVSFSCQSANIPGMSLGQAIQPTPLLDIPIPGDTLTIDSLNITYLIDEQMSNYLELYKWMKGLGFPDSNTQYKDLLTNIYNLDSPGDQFSQATLFVLSNNSNVTFEVTFDRCFPISLSGLDFNTGEMDVNPFIASTTFLFANYDIVAST